MKCIGFKTGLVVAGSLAASLLLGGGARADVRVDIYSGFTPSGGGAPYSGLVGSFISPNVDFASSTGFNWHPFGLGAFGADVTGFYQAATTGNYTFGTYSDDGSLLFLNGVLNVDNGGVTNPRFRTGAPVSLTAGDKLPLEIQYFEDGTGLAGLDLYVLRPGDGDFGVVPARDLAATPEPGSLALLATGGLPLLGLLRRRRANA